jgi:hypothetical protein
MSFVLPGIGAIAAAFASVLASYKEYVVAYKNATQTGTIGNAIEFEVDHIDEVNAHNTSSNKDQLVIPAIWNGRYGVLQCSYTATTASGSGTLGGHFTKNGSTFDGNGGRLNSTNNNENVSFLSAPVLLTTGDVFRAIIAGSDTTPPTISASIQCRISIWLLPAGFSGCLAIKSGTQSLTANVESTIQFNGTDVYDTGGYHDPASNNTRITPGAAGMLVQLYMGCNISAGNDEGYMVLRYNTNFDFNGTTYIDLDAESGPQRASMVSPPLLTANAADYYEVGVVTSLASQTVNSDMTFFAMEVLNTSTVYAHVKRAGVDYTLTGLEAIPWDTSIADAFGFWSSGDPTKFIIPAGQSGTYLVGCNLGSVVSGADFGGTIWVNGAEVPGSAGNETTTPGTDYTNFTSGPLELVAGDYVQIAAFGQLDAGNVNNFWIRKISEVSSPIITYTHRYQTNSSPGTSFTVSSVNLGAEEADRQILIFLSAVSTATVNFTSLTANGVVMRRVGPRFQYQAGAQFLFSAAFVATVPTGTSVSVDVVLSSNPSSAFEMRVYRVVNCGSRPFSHRQATSTSATSLSPEIPVKTSGALAAFCGVGSPTPTLAGTFSGTGLPAEDDDLAYPTNHRTASYHLNTSQNSSTTTFTCTESGAAEEMLVNVVSFAPDTYTDFWGLTEILCGFNGADAATSFTDESRNERTVTFAGNAQLDTAQFKFDTASLLTDGTGDYVSIAQASAFAITQGGVNRRFTIEGFWRWAGDAAIRQPLAAQWNTVISGRRHWILERDQPGGTLRFLISTGTTNETVVCSATWAPTLNTWYHVCIDFDGTTYRLYVDGVMLASSTTIITCTDPSTNSIPVTINGYVSGLSFNGWCDEFSMVMDEAKYANGSGFTAPVAAFARS